MISFSSKLKNGHELSLEEIDFILTITIGSLKTAKNSLHVLKTVDPKLSLTSALKKKKKY